MSSDDPRITEARRLRGEEGLSCRQIQELLGVSKTTLQDWLRGIPPPEWTRRANAKDDLRARAVELRGQGWSVNDIALEVGVARSTAWQWVRHLPLDPDSDRARRKREHARLMSSAQWDGRRKLRDDRRAATQTAAAALVGEVSERELLLVGAGIYWCEGKKSKPWRPHDCRIVFTNSDAGLLRIFIRFLELVGVDRSSLTCRVTIHESADALAATRWWAEQLGLPLDCFRRPTLKRHRPTTNRLNTGSEYRGCVVIDVPRSREIYWRIEGIMARLCEATNNGVGTADR